MRLLQHSDDQGCRRVIVAEGSSARFLNGPDTVRELALAAIAARVGLRQAVLDRARTAPRLPAGRYPQDLWRQA